MPLNIQETEFIFQTAKKMFSEHLKKRNKNKNKNPNKIANKQKKKKKHINKNIPH